MRSPSIVAFRPVTDREPAPGLLRLALVLWVALLGSGCGRGEAGRPSNVIRIDGSSTVFLITQAVAEEFQARTGARLAVGVSGTGGGFKKFCNGETDLIGASRPIKPSEVERCANNNIRYIELPVAYDGVTVVVHPDNDWVDEMTIAELRTLWEPEAQGTITRWSQIREGWPDKEIHLFGAGVDSGTYDYFTKAVIGIEHASRGDFTNSEDDNVLVQGISTDPLALGFFGFAYFAENQGRLKVVPIKADSSLPGVVPSVKTVADGSYQPLSRPVFIYVNSERASRGPVAEFVRFYIGGGHSLVQEVGYIPLPADAYQLVLARFDSKITGSVFDGKGTAVGVSVEDLLSRSAR